MTAAPSQISMQELTPNLLGVIVRQNNFPAGEIDTVNRTFYSAPRSTKNLFRLFGESGLGINEEILLLDLFDIIKIKFNDSILTTTRRKWLAKGIVSPYCDSTVDKQVILKLSDINLMDPDKYEPEENRQQELFDEVKSNGKAFIAA